MGVATGKAGGIRPCCKLCSLLVQWASRANRCSRGDGHDLTISKLNLSPRLPLLSADCRRGTFCALLCSTFFHQVLANVYVVNVPGRFFALLAHGARTPDLPLVAHQKTKFLAAAHGGWIRATQINRAPDAKKFPAREARPAANQTCFFFFLKKFSTRLAYQKRKRKTETCVRRATCRERPGTAPQKQWFF